MCRASHGKLLGVRSASVGQSDGETFLVCPGKEERGGPSCLKDRAEPCGQNAGLRSCSLTDTGHRETFVSPEDGRTLGRTVRERMPAGGQAERALPEPLAGGVRRL